MQCRGKSVGRVIFVWKLKSVRMETVRQELNSSGEGSGLGGGINACDKGESRMSRLTLWVQDEGFSGEERRKSESCKEKQERHLSHPQASILEGETETTPRDGSKGSGVLGGQFSVRRRGTEAGSVSGHRGSMALNPSSNTYSALRSPCLIYSSVKRGCVSN